MSDFDLSMAMYHEGYEAARRELELLKRQYEVKIANVDFCEGFFDAISDFSGD